MSTIKILADGTEIPAADPRTDHVAVLFPDTGWLVAVTALATKTGRPLKSADAVDKAAAELDLLGHTDWTTAPLDEVWLRHILKHDRYDPAVDTNLFPNLPRSDWHWTGTLAPWLPTSATFYVYLYTGGVGNAYRDNSGFGLACRRVRG